MNSERFEERLMHELKSYVHERANERDAAESGARAESAARNGRRFTRPRTIAVGAGVAAVIAAASVAGTVTVAGTAGGSPTPRQQLVHIVNAAYDVQQEPTGVVKLTILDASGKPNVDKLRSDLAKAGVNARVLSGVADCTRPQPHPTPTSDALPPGNLPASRMVTENGKEVWYFAVGLIMPGETLTIMFPQNPGTLRVLGVEISSSDDLPTCMPNATFH